jgi:protoporphyrinogen/coproporphyrinogen III oxidase
MSVTAENRVIVVGAGVAGLTAAFRLQQHGLDVTVLEAEEYIGGKTSGTSRAGFEINRGASVLSAGYARVLALVNELGLESRLVSVDPTIGIVHDGDIHLLRGEGLGAVVDAVRTPLLSPRSKLLLLRAAIDAFGARECAAYDQPALRAKIDTESVGEYCQRRLNAEILDRVLSPLMGGLYLTTGARISVADLYCMLTKFIKGMVGYEGRIDFVARALADRLDIATRSTVSLIERTDAGARVVWTADGAEHEEHVAGVISTVTAGRVADIYPGLDPNIQRLLHDDIPYANYLGIHFALSRRPDIDAVLLCVPEDELGGLSTVAFQHYFAPGSTPAGKGLVSAYVSHEWITPRLHLPDQAIIDEILPQLERVIAGVSDMIEFVEVVRWVPGAPRPEPGVYRAMADLDRYLNQDTTVQLAGDYLSFPSVNGSVVSGETAAHRLAVSIGARRRHSHRAGYQPAGRRNGGQRAPTPPRTRPISQP